MITILLTCGLLIITNVSTVKLTENNFMDFLNQFSKCPKSKFILVSKTLCSVNYDRPFGFELCGPIIYVIIYVYSKHKLQINQEYLTKLRFVAPVVSFVILANQEHLTKLRFVAPLLSLVIFAILSFFQ